MSGRVTLVLATGLIALVVVSTALASRPATPSERVAILRAAPKSPYPPGYARLTVKVSTVSSAWAAVYIRARRGHANQVQPDVVSLQRQGGRWAVHQQGNGGGCRMPARVKRDLRLACY